MLSLLAGLADKEELHPFSLGIIDVEVDMFMCQFHHALARRTANVRHLRPFEHAIPLLVSLNSTHR
jgi:hypothetical protein